MAKQALCASCGQDKALTMNHGEKICASCSVVGGSVASRPEVAVRMLIKRGNPEAFVGLLAAELGQEWLARAVGQNLPEQVAVLGESKTIAQIAEMVGYDGVIADELVGTVAVLADREKDLTLELDVAKKAIETHQGTIDALVKRAEDVESELRHLLGPPPEASLFDAVYSLINRAALQEMELTSAKETITAYQDRVNELIGKLQERTAGKLAEGQLLPESGRLDSHLLDLALAVIRGEVTGINDDWIAAIREAA